MRLLMLIVALIVSGAAPAVAGPFEDGITAYKEGDYATARRLLRPLAEQGDARAQFSIGAMYTLGQGVPQDYAAAVSWYRKAAEQGEPSASLPSAPCTPTARACRWTTCGRTCGSISAVPRAMPMPPRNATSSPRG